MIAILLSQVVILKDILPKCSRAVCARTNIHGNSPVAGIFSPAFEPAHTGSESSIGTSQACLQSHRKLAVSIPLAFAVDLSSDRKNENPFSKWVLPSQLLIGGNT